jgi:hypothetical protein
MCYKESKGRLDALSCINASWGTGNEFNEEMNSIIFGVPLTHKITVHNVNIKKCYDSAILFLARRDDCPESPVSASHLKEKTLTWTISFELLGIGC